MTDILVLSLGTTPVPLEECIARVRPQRAVFVCSQDTRVLVDRILTKVRVTSFDPTRDVLVLGQGTADSDLSVGEIDQLHAVYLRCRDLLERIRLEEPGAQISVDYTGGTKTMATGLGLAAIDDGRVDLSLMTVDRRKAGTSMISGNSRPNPVNTGAIHFRRLLSDGLEPQLRRFDYAAAQASVSQVLRLRLDDASSQTLRQLEDLLLALDAWDRWDLDRAQNLLRDHAGETTIRNQLLFPLQRLMQSCELLSPPTHTEGLPPPERALKANKSGRIHGLEAVEDLLHNASRRVSQERYDDAVGRLYRSLELTAQLLLLIDHQGIRTADVQVELLPEPLRASYEEKRHPDHGRIELGLVKAFDLLAKLSNPAGIEWAKRRSEFVDAVQIRNNSLLAHGFSPVSFASWQRLDATLGAFLRWVLDQRRGSLAPRQQLPRTLAELGVA